MEERIAESSEIIHRVFLQALDDIKLHTLPGMTVDKYKFVTESDWGSGHCNQKTELMNLGNHAKGSFYSSYLGELNSIVV